ncbi:MAG: 50S ribosomal protein L22, partial [Candidatus Margulisiibacteriota bacterium]
MTKVKAQAKWVRISARKVRIIMDLIRGKAAGDAVRLLKVMPHKAARIVEKVLLSAVANAKNNYKLSENELFVTEIFADSAAML